MQVNHNQAKLLFSAYVAVIAILYMLWLYSESTALVVSFHLLLIVLYVWVFIKSKYFLSLVKRNGGAKSIEIILTRLLSIIMLCSSCYVIYTNIAYI